MNEFLAMWTNAFNVEDRTNQRGFWIAVLFNLFILVALHIIGIVLPYLSFLSTLYMVISCIPSFVLKFVVYTILTSLEF